jgi:hypothetical protein
MRTFAQQAFDQLDDRRRHPPFRRRRSVIRAARALMGSLEQGQRDPQHQKGEHARPTWQEDALAEPFCERMETAAFVDA